MTPLRRGSVPGRHPLLTVALHALVAGGLLGAAASCSCSSDPGETSELSETPLYGGQITAHVFGLGSNASALLDSSRTTQVIQLEVHETLLLRDWETTRFVPSVAKAWHEEDLVILAKDAPKVVGEVEAQVYRSKEDSTLDPRRVVYGAVSESGAGFKVKPASPGSDLEEAIELAAEHVERVEKACVFTFELRDDVPWQPSLVYQGDDLEKTAGQMVDAADVLFSWELTRNPGVSCDFKRFRFEAAPDCRIVDDGTVRFFGAGQSAYTLEALGISLTLMPSHIFNLSDPDCPDAKADATAAQQATHVNENEHNRLWVGVGPYQITSYEQQYIEATRFATPEGEPLYFDADTRPGYADSLRWRLIPNGGLALEALLAGEVDYVERISPDDYFGERTTSDTFTSGFVKGSHYLGDYSYVCWNMFSPKLKDLQVRKAIAHAFDMESYLSNQNKGLGRIMTGPITPGRAAYPADAKHLAYDPDLALQILEDAGWYDHTGDGIADKDGVELEIELLYPAGSSTFKILSRAIQDAVKPLGIKINVVAMDFEVLRERLHQRQFEGAGLALFTTLESDPEQLWHSEHGAPDAFNTSNNAGVMDPEVDRLIGLIQREPDTDARNELRRTFHRYVYEEIQPFLFCLNVPMTYAVSAKLGGIEPISMTPGYVLRQWYYRDPSVPGTRKELR